MEQMRVVEPVSASHGDVARRRVDDLEWHVVVVKTEGAQ
jgi:hypothetical protein